MRKGFSLIECLLAMSLFMIVLTSSLQVYLSVRTHFHNLIQAEEAHTAAHAALDRMKADIQEAGSGLHEALALGWFDALHLSENRLTLRFAESEHPVNSGVSPGNEWIPLDSTGEFKTGQEVCIHDSFRGELKIIRRIADTGIWLSSPLIGEYRPYETSLIKIKKISFYLDRRSHILRRKVNSSPAQPLCENVSRLVLQYETALNLVSVLLTMSKEEDTPHETTIFPKNIAVTGMPGF